MTAIAAIRTDHHVAIGGDSAGVDEGYRITIRRDPKVFRVGPFVLGCAGSPRPAQLLRFGAGDLTLETLEPRGDPQAFMVREFIPRARAILDAGGAGEEKAIAILVGWGNQLFSVYGDWQIEEPHRPYAAAGCAAEIVLGALAATEQDKGFREFPAARIRTALRAAVRHSAAVREPFVILET